MSTYFLMPSLNAAFPFAEMNNVGAIAKDLDLNMPTLRIVLL
jgi:hypothetical protein